MSAYRKDFDETKYMSFLIKDDELLEKYNEIWKKIKNNLKKEFDSELEYNEKFHDCQLLEELGIPSSKIKIVKTVKDSLHDCLWHYLSTLKDCIGCPRFSRLTKVAKLILIIPHSKTQEERVCLLVRKNKTCFRQNLDLDEFLASTITCKFAIEGESVTKLSISHNIMSTVKQATTKFNKQHSQK